MDDTTPRRKLDFIYQEVLGEVAELVKRLEIVSSVFDELSKRRPGERTAEVIEHAATAAASRVRGELERAVEQARRRVTALIGEVKSEAENAVHVARWHELARTTGLAVVAGFVGGGLVVLCHLAGWW